MLFLKTTWVNIVGVYFANVVIKSKKHQGNLKYLHTIFNKFMKPKDDIMGAYLDVIRSLA